MADICVVGSGPAGLAIAARTAKNGHAVSLFEAGPHLGGRLRTLLRGGQVVETGAADMLLPAALRDLFRKSGRPLERELGLEMIEGTRDHHELEAVGDIAIPLTGRGNQLAALTHSVGPEEAPSWIDAIDRAGELWAAKHADWENLPYGTDEAFRFTRKEIQGPLSPAMRLPANDAGATKTTVPGIIATRLFLEQSLGRWRPQGGSAALADVLVSRLSLRGVTVHAETPVVGLLGSGRAISGIRTAAGDQHADVVILTVGIPEMRLLLRQPLRAKGLRSLTFRLTLVPPAPVPAVTLGTVDADQAPDAYETVFHRMHAVVRRLDAQPGGRIPFTVLRYGSAPLPLQLTDPVDIVQPPFANGPAFVSPRQLQLVPHIHGQVPGLMVAGPATHLAGTLATELLSAAIASDALGRANSQESASEESEPDESAG
jgi:glycine/D-amino acid oxidase-like deaminating enzyme